MRDVYPVKYYKDEGFIERKIEIDEDDLERIIEEYLSRHADFDFDEVGSCALNPQVLKRSPIHAPEKWAYR